MADTLEQPSMVDQQEPPKKYKVSQQVLSDFSATVTAKPNLTKEELLSKFPEFNNDTNLLQSALDYSATSKSGKYKTVEELNSKFPEFDFGQKKSSSETSSNDLLNGQRPASFALKNTVPQSVLPSNPLSGSQGSNEVSKRPAQFDLNKSGFAPEINTGEPKLQEQTTTQATDSFGLTPIQDLQKQNVAAKDNTQPVIPNLDVFNKQINVFGQTTDKSIIDNQPDGSLAIRDDYEKQRKDILNPKVIAPAEGFTPDNNFGMASASELQKGQINKVDNGIPATQVIQSEGLPKNKLPEPTAEETFHQKQQDNLERLNKQTIAKAGAYASTVTSDPISAGFITKAILGDNIAIAQKREVDKGETVPPADLYNIGQAGLSSFMAALDEKYKDDPKNATYLAQKKGLEDQSTALIDKFPEYKRSQITTAVAQELKKLHPEVANNSAMALLYLPEIKKDMGLSDADIKDIDFDNYPSTGFLASAIAPIYRGALSIGAGATRVIGTAIGADPDVLNARINEMQQVPSFFNDAETIQNTGQMVDANKNNRTYLQNIADPNKGKYNYNFHTMSNAIGEGVGQLAWFIYGTKAAGAIGNKIVGAAGRIAEPEVASAMSAANKGEMLSFDEVNALNRVTKGIDGSITVNNIPFKLSANATNEVGMANLMIGQGYEDNYQKSRTVISDKPEDEWKRHAFSLLQGSLDYLGFRVLGNVVKGMPPSAEQSIADVIKEAPSLAKVNKTVLQSKILNALKASAKETAFVGSATTLSEVAKAAVINVMGNDEAAKEENKQLPDNILHSIAMLPFSMGIPIAASKLISGVPQSKMFNENLYNAGLNPDTYKGQANKLFNLGGIDQTQLNDRIQVINTADQVIRSIPPDINDKLNHNQRVTYFNSKVKELALKAKKDNIEDDALAGFYDKQIKDEVDKRIGILNGGGKAGEYPNPKQDETIETKNEVPKSTEEAGATSEGIDKVSEAATVEPTQEQIADDYKNKKFTTAEYNSESEVPDIWKNKISSTGETNGKKIVRVTLPTSQFEYESKTGDGKGFTDYPLKSDVKEPVQKTIEASPEIASEKPNRFAKIKAAKESATAPDVSTAIPKVDVGEVIKWDVFGNEEMGDWTVKNETTTRGGDPAVTLTKDYVESSKDGTTYTKEYADKNGIKYENEHTIEHVVPIAELKPNNQVTNTEIKNDNTPTKETVSNPALKDVGNSVGGDKSAFGDVGGIDNMWKQTRDESFKLNEDKSTDNYVRDGRNTYERISRNTIVRQGEGKSGLSIEHDNVVFRDENGKPIGHATFTKYGIKNIGVLKENQGQGVASKMVDYLKKEKGIDKILPSFSEEGNLLSHRNEVKKALADGKYEKAITNGQMTTERANEIIKSAGLKSESLLKEQPNDKTTTSTVSNPILSNEGKQKGQEDKGTVSKSAEPVVRGAKETTTTVLENKTTSVEVINRDYKKLKEKLGQKKAQKYFEQVNKLVDPMTNEVAEYRDNGVVVKEGERYIFKPIVDTDLKTWRLGKFNDKVSDVTSQFIKEKPKEGSTSLDKNDINLQSKNDNNAELTKLLPDTLSPTEKQGSIAGGEANAAATTIVGAIQKANDAAKGRGEGLSQDNKQGKQSIPLKDEAKVAEKPTEKKADIGRFEKAARERAAQLEDKKFDWLLGSQDPNIKKSGVDLDLRKALQKSIIEVGRLMDKGAELGEAIKQVTKDFLDDIKGIHGVEKLDPKYEDNLRNGFESEAKSNFKDVLKEDGEGGGKVPPNETVSDKTDEAAPFTPIDKANLTEEGKKLKGGQLGGAVHWDESVDKGLSELMNERKGDESITDVAARKVNEWVSTLESQYERDGKYTFNPNDTEIAQLAYYRTKISETIAGLDINDKIQSEMLTAYENELFKTDFVLDKSATAAGRAFYIRQMVSRLDAEHGLEIKRKLLEKKNGEPLSTEDEDRLRKNFAKEQKLAKEKSDAYEKAMNDEFEKRVANEVNRRLNNKKVGNKTVDTTKLSEEKRTRIADRIDKIADKIDNYLRGNTEGSQKAGGSPDIQKIVADAMRYVAQGIRDNKSIPDMIKEAIQKFAGKDARSVKLSIEKELKDAGFDNNEILDKRDLTLSRIKEVSDKEKADMLTKSAVGKGLVNDLLGDAIDRGLKGKEVLTDIHDSLKEVFPDITREQVRDAVLKEGGFKLESKQKLDKQKRDDTLEVKSISKKETDLSDLKNEQELRKRNGNIKRTQSETEKNLQTEIKDLQDKKAKLISEKRRVAELERELERVSARKEKEPDSPVKNKLSEREIELKKEIKSEKDKWAKEITIKEINDNIETLKNTGDLIKKKRNSSDKEINEGIDKARKELASEINKRGLKFERGTKDDRAVKDLVSETHNNRVDDILKNIDTMLNDTKTSDADRISLNEAKAILESSKINKDSPFDKIDGIEKAEKKLNEAWDKLQDIEHLRKKVTEASKDVRQDRKDAEQQVLLNRYSKQREQNIKETTRKIEAQEFTERERPILGIKDARAIQLGIQESQVKAEYENLRRKAERNGLSKTQRVLQTLQSLYVIGLVGRISTLAKVGVSALTKQPLNTITSLSFGKLGDKIMPLAAGAKRGESTSLRVEKYRYLAHYAALGEKGMQRMVEKGIAAVNKAESHYLDMKDKQKDIEKEFGIESKEYKDFMKGDFNKAEIKLKNASLDNISNSLFEWIGGNAWKDAVGIFVHSSSRLEQLLGKAEKEQWSDKTKGEKFMQIVSLSATSHQVMKNFSARAEFAAAFVARLENKAKNGIDIGNAGEIMMTVNESWINFQRGQYQEDNLITGSFKGALKGIDEYAQKQRFLALKTVGSGIRSLLTFQNPIVRTPINIAKEAIVEYAFGIPVSASNYRKAILDAKVTAKEAGVAQNEMKGYIKDYIDNNLSSDKADFIYRTFRKGAFGAGVMLLAAAGAIKYGGFYNEDDRNRKKGELGINEVEIGGVKLSKLQSKIFDHTSAAFPALLWSNYERVVDSQKDKGSTGAEAHTQAMWQDAVGMLDAIPMGREFQNPVKNLTVPLIGPIANEVAEKLDVDTEGNPISRKPHSVLDNLKLNVGLRSLVKTDAEYKAARSAKALSSDGGNKEVINFLSNNESELRVPSIGTIKLPKTSKRPHGLMTDDEYELFKEKRADKLSEYINKLSKRDNMSHEFIKTRIKQISRDATEYAKSQVIKMK